MSDRLAATGRRAVAAGLVRASGGNLSLREPAGDACVVTAAGAWLDALTVADVSRVRVADGVVLDGAAHPSTELAVHLHAYRARPDVGGVVHVHPQHLLLLDGLGEPVRRLTTDHAAYLGEVRTVAYAPPGTEALGAAVGAAVRDGASCVVLPRHGIVAVGPDLEAAFRVAANLEEAATLTYRALLLDRGRLRGLPDLDLPAGHA